MTNISEGLRIKSNSEFISEILKKDSVMLTSLLLTSISEISSAEKYLKEMSAATSDINFKKEIEQRIEKLRKITLMKVDLTADALDIASNGSKPSLYIPAQPELPFAKSEGEDIKDRKPEDKGKVIKMSPKVAPSEDKVLIKPELIDSLPKETTRVEETQTVTPGKKNYQLDKTSFVTLNRYKVWGTGRILPPAASEYLKNNPKIDTESKVDELCFLLVKDNQFEVAVNMAIDLFCIEGVGNIPKKEELEVVKRFYKEIYPWINNRLHPPKNDRATSATAKLDFKTVSESVKAAFRNNQPEAARQFAYDYLAHAKEKMADQIADYGSETIEQLLKAWESDVKKEVEAFKSDLEKGRDTVETKDFLKKVEDYIKEEFKVGNPRILNGVMQLFRPYRGKLVKDDGKVMTTKEMASFYRETMEGIKKEHEEAKAKQVSDEKLFTRIDLSKEDPKLLEEAKKNVSSFSNFAAFLVKLVTDTKDWVKAVNLALDMIPNNEFKGWEFCKDWNEEKVHSWFKRNIIKVKETKLEPNKDFEKEKPQAEESEKTTEATEAVKEEPKNEQKVEDKVESPKPVETKVEDKKPVEEESAKAAEVKTEKSVEEPKAETKEEPKEETTAEKELPVESETTEQKIKRLFADKLMSRQTKKAEHRALCAKFLLLKDYKTYPERYKELVEVYLKSNPKWSRGPISEITRYVDSIIAGNKDVADMHAAEHSEKAPF